MGCVLVTGCAGFIGFHTTELLLSEGYQVIGIDNFNDYYDPRLKNFRVQQLQKKMSFQFLEGDIENVPFLNDVFAQHQFETVFNLAAMAGVRFSVAQPLRYMNTNVIGTLHLLELMAKYKVEKFILASTSSIYGDSEIPFHENQAVNRPLSPYAASKKSAELISYSYHHNFGIDVSVLRFFTVYGPAGRPDMSYFRFISAIAHARPITLYGDGSQSRDFTYVSDIASGVVAAKKAVGYEIVNLGGGNEPTSMNEVISILEKSLKKKAIIHAQPFHKADAKVTRANIEKAKTILDWQPHVNLQTGLDFCVNWYLQNRELVDSLSSFSKE